MMEKIDYLITGGCSFSQLNNADVTWPVHLESELAPSIAVHTGRGSAGNRVISRLVIIEVIKALQAGVNPAQILVAIMWSGVNRHDVYTTNPEFPHTDITLPTDSNYYNPLNLACKERNTYIVNAHWQDPSSRVYFENLHDELGSLIATLEHALRVQWFLQRMGIKYIMTEYSFDCINQTANVTVDGKIGNQPQNFLQHPDAKILWSMMDLAHWLPVKNMSYWVDHHGIPYSRPNDRHPSTHAHQRFTQEIIVPHLKKLEYV